MNQWEYWVSGAYYPFDHRLDQEEMARLGAEGWELVAVIQPSPQAARQLYYKRLLAAAKRAP